MARDIVDIHDHVIGVASEQDVAAERLICRVAFVMLVNSAGELLLHQRAASKKSYPLYWSGAAAGHVKQGESYEAAATREVREELGITTDLEFVGKFFSSEERKMVAVFLGHYDGPMNIEHREVEQVAYFPVDRLVAELSTMKATSFVDQALHLVLPRLASP